MNLSELEYKDGRILRNGEDRSTVTHQGYRQLYVDGKCYLLHRLVFFYHHGYWPKVVDHIDGDRQNNRIENLQDCSMSENIAKAKLFKTNKTGHKGVSFNKKSVKYESYIWRDYKRYYLGLHKTAEEAHKAREKFLTEKYGAQNEA